MAIYMQPNKDKEIFEVMQKGVELRNELFVKANNPTEPHNALLVRRYYAALRREIGEAFGELFSQLSEIVK